MKLKLSYSLISLGVVLGIFGYVRSGAISIALGSASVTYLRFQRSKLKRRIEFVLPLALAATLFVVALTLPHGK